MFTETTQISLSHTAAYCYIAFACILGLIYGIYNWCKVTNIDTLNAETNNQRIVLKDDQIKEMNDTSQKIAEVIINYFNSYRVQMLFYGENTSIFLYSLLFSVQ